MESHTVAGRLEVICGSMFSGKSEELIRRMRRAEIGKRKTQLFKHCKDNRKTLCHVNAHNGDMLAACPIENSGELEQLLHSDTEVIGIDEIQFFSPEIILLVDRLVTQGKRVIAAGLDLDFRGLPFGCMPVLLALADEILKLKAVCTQSGKDAHFTQRLVNGEPAKHTDPTILVGAQECYEARARECYKIDCKPLDEYLKTHSFAVK
ncbi:TPA: thymidine kinase [Candidatus Dependentiae bacterium]|nr:MAG: Thymidine kinase [candidate division TM6 bacterium GW2011_GWF2_43_87]HBL98058.1 thymidine kinase [Candidatus Dependentiae bacterium]